MTDDAFAEALGQQDAAIASMLDGDPGPIIVPLGAAAAAHGAVPLSSARSSLVFAGVSSLRVRGFATARSART